MSQRHRMPAADVAWLHMDRPTNLMVNNVVLWFDTPLDWQRVKDICQERLVDKFRRFSQCVAEPRVPWRSVAWEDDPRFDLEHHFHRLALPAPGDRAALMELVADLMATPLDRDKPLWDMYLVEGYGPGCAILWRTHHCIADGIALARVFLSLTDDAPNGSVAPAPLAHQHRRRARPTRPRQLARLMRAAEDQTRVLTKLLLTRSDADTALRGELGVSQRVGSTRPMPLAEVKRTGHATGTTVNDVVLSAVTGALRGYLLERGTPVAEIRAFVPFNLRPLSEPIPPDLGNKFGPVLLTLPVGLHAPQERLAEVHRRMAEIKQSPEGAVSYGALSATGMAPPDIGRAIIDLYTAKASALITNVPGPPRLVHLAGTPVRGMLAWAPRPGSMSMSVTIFSYNGDINVGLAADAGLIPDPERILARVEGELGDLQRGRGVDVRHRPTLPV
jgi:WS/DGAT/MGAT family acyltransferase